MRGSLTEEAKEAESDSKSDDELEAEGLEVNQWVIFGYANKILYSVVIIVLGKQYREVSKREIDLKNFQY